jgi:GNAT superfamily N-acetyltransferase
MSDLSPGWATDLAVLELSGATIERRQDHLVIRQPANPDFHWGNCVFVTDSETLDDPSRWVEVFQHHFPDADWVALGLVQLPNDATAWTNLGLPLELDDVLTTRSLPALSPLPDGYTVRRLTGPDWELAVARSLAENVHSGEYDPALHERFIRAQVQIRQDLSDQDLCAFFGAFRDDALVADLGIVRCGTTARYQAVGTDHSHRGRGLASHLLGVAARWAGDLGCDQWVIVTEATNSAGRVYRRVGFEPDAGNAQAYRRPPRLDSPVGQ